MKKPRVKTKTDGNGKVEITMIGGGGGGGKSPEIVEVKAPVVIKKWKTSKQFREIFAGTPVVGSNTDLFRGGRAHNRKLKRRDRKVGTKVS